MKQNNHSITHSVNGIRDFFRNFGEFLKFCLKTAVSWFEGNPNKAIGVQCSGKIVIIGNGPSAGAFDWMSAKAKGYALLCVNAFAAKNDAFFQMKPQYYTVIDPTFYQNDDDYGAATQSILRALERVDWPMTLICLRGQQLPLDNPNIHTVHVSDIIFEGGWNTLKYRLYQKNLATYRLQNVVTCALFFCLTAHTECICLTGVEHDLHRALRVDEHNDVYCDNKHFYGQGRQKLTGKSIEKGELYKYLFACYLSQKSFWEAAQYAAYLSVPVYNLVSDSYLDMFDKLEDLP